MIYFVAEQPYLSGSKRYKRRFILQAFTCDAKNIMMVVVVEIVRCFYK